MKELIQTNDLATLAYIKLLLTNERIKYFEMDTHMSSLEGSINILPRRILVSNSSIIKAKKILIDSGIELT
ncbi:MAG: DUF2007 domain-containing protein [Paracoccaceae bacterium]